MALPRKKEPDPYHGKLDLVGWKDAMVKSYEPLSLSEKKWVQVLQVKVRSRRRLTVNVDDVERKAIT